MRRPGRVVALFLLLAGVALALLPWPAALVERVYLGALLPAWTAVSAPVVDTVGFSVSGVVLILLVCVPLAWLLAAGRRALRGVLSMWGAAGLVLLLLFSLTFGLAYRLPGVAEREGLMAESLTAEARGALELRVLELLTSSSAWSRGGPAAASNAVDRADLHAGAARCVARLATDLRAEFGPATLPQRVKLLPAGLMLRFGFAGITLPWLLEPHVDAGLAPVSALGVALHELAHSAGYAAEAEAEAVGLVAGLECEDQRVVYAAALRLAGSMAAALPADERQAFMAQWPAAAHADVRAADRATRRFEDPRLTRGATAAYDLYLRSQGEEGGMAEYDRGTQLALLLFHARHLAPLAPAAPAP